MVGEGGPLAADAPPWAAPLFGFELLVDAAPRRPAPFAPLPTTPSSERVLALLLPEGVRAREVETLLRRAGAPLLERMDVESDYRGPELPSGTRSVAFRLGFRARTARSVTARWTRPKRGSWPRSPRSWASSDGTAGPAPESDRGIHL